MVSPVRFLWESMSSQRRELALAAVLGAIASASAIALLGTSGWLISRAAEMPPVLTLTVAAVMVRFLALSRALFRYGERLVGHDAAFRGLTELRVVVYTNLERLAPTGLKAFGRGDLLVSTGRGCRRGTGPSAAGAPALAAGGPGHGGHGRLHGVAAAVLRAGRRQCWASWRWW